MDLKTLDTSAAAEQGFELELSHPTNAAPLGIFITVLGRDSDAYSSLQTAQTRKRLERMQKLNGRMTLSPDELERDAVELLAAVTKTWRVKDKTTLLLDDEE